MSEQALEELHVISSPHVAGYRELTATAAAPKLGRFRLIDVREPAEYVGPLGHLAGAELVPLATVLLAASTWNRAEPILLICRSGKRSGTAAAALAERGFTELYNLVGGMLDWNHCGLALESP